VLIVDDVLTTGTSIFEVVELVKKYNASIVGIGEFLDRSGGRVKLAYPFKPLATISADAWNRMTARCVKRACRSLSGKPEVLDRS